MRDPRINPAPGDVLAIGVSQWTVRVVDNDSITVLRMGSRSIMNHGEFCAFFKSASTVRYGDES